jgi:formate hydrogenlyase subunit 4
MAEANGPVALGIHAGLGLLLVVGSISLVVRSVLSRNRALIVLSAVFLLAVLGAASSGASFVDSGHDSESASMAMLTGVALICALISLYVAGRGSREVTTR